MVASTMNPEVSLHSDMRSTHHAYKRDKDSSMKWGSGGRRPSRFSSLPGQEVQPPYKTRPKKRVSELPHAVYRFKSTNSSKAELATASGSENPASRRIARKSDAVHESSSDPELTKSLLDMLPVAKMFYGSKVISRLPSDVGNDDCHEGALFSFDKVQSASTRFDLHSLVDHAEKKFLTCETDRIVREEWQTIDEHGQVQNLSRKKYRKDGQSKKIGNKCGRTTDVVDDDWEVLNVRELDQ